MMIDAQLRAKLVAEAQKLEIPPIVCPLCGAPLHMLFMQDLRPPELRARVIETCPRCRERIEVHLQFKMVFDRVDLVRVV
jgi:hypothetical protein